MPRSGPGPMISRSLSVTVPESGFSSPAMRLISVVLPAPENPTIATNSPLSMDRLMSLSTSLLEPFGPKPFETLLSSRNGMTSSCFEPLLGQTHQAVQDEADHPNCDNAQDDVLVNQRVVLLPEETAHAGTAGEHFGGDNHQPSNSETEPEAGENVRQRRRDQHLEQGLGARKFEHFGDVQIV